MTSVKPLILDSTPLSHVDKVLFVVVRYYRNGVMADKILSIFDSEDKAIKSAQQYRKSRDCLPQTRMKILTIPINLELINYSDNWNQIQLSNEDQDEPPF